MFETAILLHQRVPGVVVHGYRHHDGCVQVVADIVYCNEGDGRTYGSGVCLPTIMRESEYQYFKSNKERFVYWIKYACKSGRINPDHITI